MTGVHTATLWLLRASPSPYGAATPWTLFHGETQDQRVLYRISQRPHILKWLRLEGILEQKYSNLFCRPSLCTAQSIQSPFAKGAEGYVCWEQVTPRAGKNSFIPVVRPWSVRFCFLFGDPNLEAKPPLVLGISTPLSGWPFFWQNLDEVRTIC